MNRYGQVLSILVVLVGIFPACAAHAGIADVQSEIDASRRNAITTAIEKVAPAVVSINVLVEQRWDPFADDFWDFFMRPRSRFQEVNSIGSGFIFDPRGYVLTNFHVIGEASYIESVTLPDGRDLKAEFVGGDERTDLAVLRIEGDKLPYIPLGDSDDLVIGEWVIAIGNPFGNLMGDPQPSVSVGVVSANHRRVNPRVGGGMRLYQGMIQTDAAINPGNSGGPLVNAKGEAVGVNTMIFSTTGGSVGLGFAIPANRAKRVTEEIITYGRRRDPWAGFKVEDVQSLRPDIRAQLGISIDTGVVVVNLLRDSPAYEAGLRPGDVIVAVNGVSVTNSAELDFVIWDRFVGDSLAMELDRQGESIRIRFTIAEMDQLPR